VLKIKPERVAGIVALSYLVLIPAAGVFLWKRQEMMGRNIDEVWIRIQHDDPKGTWASR
jgi:hypothetical protein